MTIRVDVTTYSTVVRCSKCPGWHWAGEGGDRARAHREAQHHEAAVHPGVRQAHDAAMKYFGRNVHQSASSSDRGIEVNPLGDRVGEQPGRPAAGA